MSKFWERPRAFATALTATLVGVGFLVAMASAGWPGATNGCLEPDATRPDCFCERSEQRWIAQPANTLSNLGFVGVGLAIGVWADRRRRRGTAAPSNPIDGDPRTAALFAAVIALLGPGSMALHASQTIWGGQVDVASMYLFSSLVIAFGVQRITDCSWGRFAGLFAGLFALLVATKLWIPIESNIVFGSTLVSMIVVDLVARRRRPERRRDTRYLVAAVTLFLAAFAIWLPSRTGGPWCDPNSWLQGHALWHLLCALAAAAVFLYLHSEQEEPTPA
ncbi:MAG: ceramidase domain-containing protein [Proteobacteria bacterium]|nr:ceramidase domain-containing protein [Pseudomonadota bacterium]